MAIRPRALYKRELDRASDNLGWCYKHLERVAEAYSLLHPEIAEQARLLMMAVVELASAVYKLNEEI